MNRTTRIALPALALTSALVLGACGTSDSNSDHGMGAMPAAHGSASTLMGNGTAGTAGTSAGEHNQADTMFAQMMIVHHRGAIEMAKLATTNANNTKVKSLGAKIQAAQQPEIDLMSSWLGLWGAMSPNGMSMDGLGAAHDMPGMMNDQQMADLTKATGTAFDRMFLQMMTEHHQGAITMAKTELSSGTSVDAKALAAKIIADQTAEISLMAALLTSL